MNKNTVSACLDIRKECPAFIHCTTPEEYPLNILRFYLEQSESARFKITGFGDSEPAMELMRKLNAECDAREEALRKAIELLEGIHPPKGWVPHCHVWRDTPEQKCVGKMQVYGEVEVLAHACIECPWRRKEVSR